MCGIRFLSLTSDICHVDSVEWCTTASMDVNLWSNNCLWKDGSVQIQNPLAMRDKIFCQIFTKTSGRVCFQHHIVGRYSLIQSLLSLWVRGHTSVSCQGLRFEYQIWIRVCLGNCEKWNWEFSRILHCTDTHSHKILLTRITLKEVIKINLSAGIAYL